MVNDAGKQRRTRNRGVSGTGRGRARPTYKSPPCHEHGGLLYGGSDTTAASRVPKGLSQKDRGIVAFPVKHEEYVPVYSVQRTGGTS